MERYVRIKISEIANVTEKLTAYELSGFFADQVGMDIPVVFDNNIPCRGDIVIGYQGELLQGHHYLLKQDDGVMMVSAASEYGYQECMVHLQVIILQNNGILEDGFYMEGDASDSFEKDSSQYYLTHREGDVRLMMFNIYGWNGHGGVSLRAQMQQALIASYRPDVVGFQEFGDFNEHLTCRSTLKQLLRDIGYLEVGVSHENGTNCTPLFYNSATVQLKADDSCGYFCYSGPNDVNSKSITWAFFETKKEKKVFCALSTHFMWSAPKLENPNAVRISNAKELLDLVAQIQKDYGEDIPIIAGGDLNCFPSSDPVRVLVQGGLQWLYYLADEKQEYGYPGYPAFDEEKKYYTQFHAGQKFEGDVVEKNHTIDLILGCGKMRVLTYITVNDKYALCSSDHAPKLTDVLL